MKKLTTIFVLAISLGFASASYADIILTPTTSGIKTTTAVTSDVFIRTLSVGSYGADVMALKKILSLELGTTAESGASFTTTTKNNVIKLQNKYAVKILIPIGLSAGTGFVGSATMPTINDLANKYYIKLSDFTAPALTVVSTVKNLFVSALSLGSTGNEVSLLKIVLNSNTDTALSPKNSTNIFDLATRDAVNKFQLKYASEVLTPTGLTHGTGTVGPATRKKLNSLINRILASTNPSSTPAGTQPSTQTMPTAPVYYPDISVIQPFGTPISDPYCNNLNWVEMRSDGNGGQYIGILETAPTKCVVPPHNKIVTPVVAKYPLITSFLTNYESDPTHKTKTFISLPDSSGNAVITVFTQPINTYKVFKDKAYMFREFDAAYFLYTGLPTDTIDCNETPGSQNNTPTYEDDGNSTWSRPNGYRTIGNCGDGVNPLIVEFPFEHPENFDFPVQPTIIVSPTNATISTITGTQSFTISSGNFTLDKGKPSTYTTPPIWRNTYYVKANGLATTTYTLKLVPIDCDEMYRVGVPVGGMIISWSKYRDLYLVKGLSRSHYMAKVEGITDPQDVNDMMINYCPQPDIPSEGYAFQSVPSSIGTPINGRAEPKIFSGYERIWSTGYSSISI